MSVHPAPARVAKRKSRAARPEREPREQLDKRTLLAALVAFKQGDFSVRLPLHWMGTDGKIADSFNELIDLNARLASELERIGRVVGEEGRIAQRATLGHVRGGWAASV